MSIGACWSFDWASQYQAMSPKPEYMNWQGDELGQQLNRAAAGHGGTCSYMISGPAHAMDKLTPVQSSAKPVPSRRHFSYCQGCSDCPSSCGLTREALCR